MKRPYLILLLLAAVCFMLTGFVLSSQTELRREESRSVLAILLGDGRRLFANHFVAKADAYFHNGRYPSIFEMAEREEFKEECEGEHAPGSHEGHDHDSHAGHLHGPQGGELLAFGNSFVEIMVFETDVPPRFRLYFYDDSNASVQPPSSETLTLDTTRPDGREQRFGFRQQGDFLESIETVPEPHDFNVFVEWMTGDASEHGELFFGENSLPATEPVEDLDWIARLSGGLAMQGHSHLEDGEEKEMLPWLKLAVELDPGNVEAYAVGGYWLRELGGPDEAESFLREGLRNNPDSHEIYFELGRLYERTKEDPVRAKRLYELSLRKWETANTDVEEPDTIALSQILGRLGSMEEQLGDFEQAVKCYEVLKTISPNPESVQALIDRTRAKGQETL